MCDRSIHIYTSGSRIHFVVFAFVNNRINFIICMMNIVRNIISLFMAESLQKEYRKYYSRRKFLIDSWANINFHFKTINFGLHLFEYFIWMNIENNNFFQNKKKTTDMKLCILLFEKSDLDKFRWSSSRDMCIELARVNSNWT